MAEEAVTRCPCGFRCEGTNEQVTAAYAVHDCPHHPAQTVSSAPFWRSVLVLVLVLAALVAMCGLLGRVWTL